MGYVNIEISECADAKGTRKWHELCRFVQHVLHMPIDALINDFRSTLDPNAVVLLPYEFNMNMLPHLPYGNARQVAYRCDSCQREITGEIWSSLAAHACSQECADKLAPTEFIKCPPIPSAEDMKRPGAFDDWMSFLIKKNGLYWDVPGKQGMLHMLGALPKSYIYLIDGSTTKMLFSYDNERVTLEVVDGKVMLSYYEDTDSGEW